ncbi:transcription antitermination factor NusB [Lacihabitans sp. LS3-19]|nr:transcription antitermination factor NusB [Lacihabitans sp. LS3-19]
MLNRRLIRIRVMQTLYAFEKAKGANFLLAQDLIAEAFAPDLNSMEKQDRNKLTGLLKLSQSLFSDEVNNDIFPSDDTLPAEVKPVLSKAREYFKHKNKKDFEFYTLQSVLDAEKVYDLYLYLMNLLPEIAQKYEGKGSLAKNRVIAAIKINKDLEHISLKRSINWENERIFINKIYNEALKTNAHVLEYEAIINKTLEDDLAIVKYIIKNVFLKHEVCDEFFEKMNIFWVEDRDILRTMMFHSINDFVELQTIKVEMLDEVWDESKEFLKILFNKTVTQEKEILGYLIPFLKNWEIERIIETDRILLKMAAAELMNFPSIPIKVTINEIIDISKNYSSAKSGQFINGILDSLNKDLTTRGLIKKTGRGMLDNK